VSTISTYPIIQLIFGLYSLNYIIPKTASSWPNGRILKFTIISRPLMLTYISPVSKLIIPSLYSTGSPEIVTKV
jgi:hypothetical protein